MLFQKSALLNWNVSTFNDHFEAKYSYQCAVSSCFRKSCLFEESEPTVSSDMDHSLGSKNVLVICTFTENIF